MVATSGTYASSPIPWRGPIGSVRVGFVSTGNGESGLFLNPGLKELEFSEMGLVVSATEKKVVMLEAGANQIKEEIILSGISKAKEEKNKIIFFINELVKEIGK